MTISAADLNQLSKAITDAIKNSSGLNRSQSEPKFRGQGQFRQRSQHSNIEEKLGNVQEKLLAAIKKRTSISNKEIAETENGFKIQHQYNTAIRQISTLMGETGNYHELVNESLRNQVKNYSDLSRKSRGLISSLAEAQLNSSQLAASLIESHQGLKKGTVRYDQYIEALGNSINGLSEKFLKQEKFWDYTNKKIKEDLNPADFAKLRASLGNAQAAITENLAKIGVDSLSSLVSDPVAFQERSNTTGVEDAASRDAFNDGLLAMAHTLSAAGHKIETDFSDPASTSFVALAKELAAHEKAINENIKALNALGKSANAFKPMATLIDTVREKIENFGELSNITAQLYKVKDALIKMYQEIAPFNIAQIPASFLEVQRASLRMGMSFNDTVKFMQENKRMIALHSSNLNETNQKLKSTFQKFGYTMEQGASMVGPAFQSAISAGIDVSNFDNLNSFIDETAKSFENVAVVAGVTMEEYAKLNADLYKTSEISETLLGLDAKQSKAYADSLKLQRDELVWRGLSIEQAQEMVKVQEAAKREKTLSRFKGAAMMSLQAQQLGVNEADTARARKTVMMGRAATPEDTAFLNEYVKNLAKLRAEKSASFTGTENLAGLAYYENFQEQTSSMMGDTEKRIQLGEQLAVAEKARSDITNIAERDRLIAAAKANQAFGELAQTVNNISSIMGNSLIGVGVALFGTISALAIRANLLNKAFGTLTNTVNSKSGIDAPDINKPNTTPDKPGGKPGGKSGIGKGLIKGGLLGLAGVGIAMGAEPLKEKVTEIGYEKAAPAIDIASTTAQGALTGAMFGPWGAAIGGGAGLAYGLYNNKDLLLEKLGMGNKNGQISEPVAPTSKIIEQSVLQQNITAAKDAASKTAAVVGGTAASMSLPDTSKISTINTSDEITHQKLTQVVDNLVSAVQILQKISDAQNTPQQQNISMRQLTTRTANITGR